MDRGWMWVTHSGSSVSSTVYIDRFSVIEAAKVAANNGKSTFFSILKSRGIKP